jgi:hypothetical protein
LKIVFEQDSRRYHRFKVVDPDGQIVGSLYIPKQMNPIPKRLVLEMKSDS